MVNEPTCMVLEDAVTRRGLRSVRGMRPGMALPWMDLLRTVAPERIDSARGMAWVEGKALVRGYAVAWFYPRGEIIRFGMLDGWGNSEEAAPIAVWRLLRGERVSEALLALRSLWLAKFGALPSHGWVREMPRGAPKNFYGLRMGAAQWMPHGCAAVSLWKEADGE